MNGQYKKRVLGNGLRLISHEMPSRQSVAVGVLINTGGRYEEEGFKGISHFLEHLIFKGSKKYSCRKIKESIEGVGGALNGFTSEELTCFLVKIPARHLELALDVLSDMALNPVIPVKEVEREKTVILEEIKMYRDQPASYVHELLDELLWPNQVLGSPIIGTVESVSRIKREDLDSYKKRFYTPSNIIVSAAGLINFDKLSKKVENIFSRQKTRSVNQFTGAIVRQSLPGLKILHKDTEQTHLALGFHSFKRGHPLRHALGILHVILGANMSSRLFNELREKRGLAYEIGTQVKRFHDTGAFLVHAGIDNRKVSRAVGLILKELKGTKAKLAGVDEFLRAKEFYMGQVMLSLEDTLEHMLWIGETTATLNKTYSLTEILKEVNRITREDVLRVAQSLFKKENLNLALIGPLKGSEKEIRKQLGIH